MKKGDVGIAKVREQGMSFRLPRICNLKSISVLSQDACQCLMLHPYITASGTIINVLS